MARRTTSRSGGRRVGAHAGRQRSARSQTRCWPWRPATMMRPWVQRRSSMRSTLRPWVQPLDCQSVAARSSSARVGSGPPDPELAQDRAAQGLVVGQPGAQLGVAGARVAAHQQRVDRVVAGADDRGRVRPVLEQAPVAPEQRVQVGQVVAAQAAPEDQLVAAGDHADRVELEGAQVGGHRHDRLGAGRRRRRAGQALAADDQPARQARVKRPERPRHLGGRPRRCGRWRRWVGVGRGCGPGPRRRRCRPRSRVPAAAR